MGLCEQLTVKSKFEIDSGKLEYIREILLPFPVENANVSREVVPKILRSHEPPKTPFVRFGEPRRLRMTPRASGTTKER